MAKRQKCFIKCALWLLLVAGLPAASGAAQWTVPVTVSNAGGVGRQLELGIDPTGTTGLDTPLGEVELPPWPPLEVFDARFMVDGLEGLYRDIRDDSPTERTHQIQIQEGSGGYPVTLRWDAAALPHATFLMKDGYTGSLITEFDMALTDSLIIPADQSYIKRIAIVVTPGELPPGPPVIVPMIPDQSIYLGQRFFDLNLDDFVEDPDNPDADLSWVLTGDGPPWVTLNPDRTVQILAPAGWTGSGSFNLRVSDPGGLQDDQDFLLTVREPGLPSWSVGMQVVNNAAETQAVSLGIDTRATVGIDPVMGEVALPPWPPSGVFDARFTLPDSLTQSRLDYRPSAAGLLTFDLVWQSGSGGYPITVTWPASLPLGSFSILDNMGGVFIPPTDMASVQSLVVPDSLSFITGLKILVEPVVDTLAPVGPEDLSVVTWAPWSTVTLSWQPCTEENFAYYEILFDPEMFTTDPQYSWDWSEDASLMTRSTTMTTVTLPGSGPGYVFRVRAWDTFGNVGSLSNYCSVGAVSGADQPPVAGLALRTSAFAPNPFNPRTGIQIELAKEARVRAVVYDAQGHRIRTLTSEIMTAGSHRLVWDGCNQNGRPQPSGSYLCRIEADGQFQVRKMTLLK